MSQSNDDQIEAILSASAPMVEAITLADSHPECVGKLAVTVMQRRPRGGTFLDAALSYLPEADWPTLVQYALDALEHSSDKNEAAESVIAHASLQLPSALHPHLDRIFKLHPNGGTYYECFPWRESGTQHFEYLRRVLENQSTSGSGWLRAWRAMIETRHLTVVDFAVSHPAVATHCPKGWTTDLWIAACLELVGFRRENNALVRTCRDSLYHLMFPASFFEDQSRPRWLARVHPSWSLPALVHSAQFGGASTNHCALCEGTLHRLLLLESIPRGLGITELQRLELATCLSCLGRQQQPLFYHHDQSGFPESVGYDGAKVQPEFVAVAIKDASIALAESPRRWFWQDWALSNSGENLNRIGGEPCWIQNAEYPQCPTCQKPMNYLMQLDSDLPTVDGNEWLWGSGGIMYGFWCDGCTVSAFLWQCT